MRQSFNLDGLVDYRSDGVPETMRCVTYRTIRGGEIVGIAGVSGNGQRQLLEVLAGQCEAASGKVIVDGELYHATREEMRERKVSCLPEEPLKNACVASMRVEDNLAFRDFDLRRSQSAIGG
jgi:general nucleoside transport system ATP-binding protein